MARTSGACRSWSARSESRTCGLFGSASKRSNDQMTQVEQSMNKARLQRATEPKTLQMLVQNKMRQCGLPGE
ncbi:unnamed protein product [Effrenium voratum]|nr:unnamed protein product [Effrenium voratum]